MNIFPAIASQNFARVVNVFIKSPNWFITSLKRSNIPQDSGLQPRPPNCSSASRVLWLLWMLTYGWVHVPSKLMVLIESKYQFRYIHYTIISFSHQDYLMPLYYLNYLCPKVAFDADSSVFTVFHFIEIPSNYLGV